MKLQRILTANMKLEKTLMAALLLNAAVLLLNAVIMLSNTVASVRTPLPVITSVDWNDEKITDEHTVPAVHTEKVNRVNHPGIFDAVYW